MLSNDNQKVITNQYLTLLLINNGFENGLSHGHKCYVKLNEADTIKSKDESIDSENENTSNGMALIIIDGPFYVTRAEHIPLVTTYFNGQKSNHLTCSRPYKTTKTFAVCTRQQCWLIHPFAM